MAPRSDGLYVDRITSGVSEASGSLARTCSAKARKEASAPAMMMWLEKRGLGGREGEGEGPAAAAAAVAVPAATASFAASLPPLGLSAAK
jgi:hypothetical protein